jgi:hypothetical protein
MKATGEGQGKQRPNPNNQRSCTSQRGDCNADEKTRPSLGESAKSLAKDLFSTSRRSGKSLVFRRSDYDGSLWRWMVATLRSKAAPGCRTPKRFASFTANSEMRVSVVECGTPVPLSFYRESLPAWPAWFGLLCPKVGNSSPRRIHGIRSSTQVWSAGETISG